MFFATLPLYHKANVENSLLRLLFSTFLECSQMPLLFYTSGIVCVFVNCKVSI